MMKYFPNVNRSFSSIYQECASLCSGRIRRAFPHPTSSTQYNAHCQDATGLWILVDSLNISGCINWIWNHSGMMNRFSEQSETNIFSDLAIVKSLMATENYQQQLCSDLRKGLLGSLTSFNP